MNGWTPTLERIRSKYGGVTGLMDAVCSYYDAQRGGANEPGMQDRRADCADERQDRDRGRDRDGDDGEEHDRGEDGEEAEEEEEAKGTIGDQQQSSRQASTAVNDCILCLQEVKITHKKLTKENCCMDESNLESFHSTSDVRPGYSGTSIYTCTPAWRPTRFRTDLFTEADGGEDGEGRFCAVDLPGNIVLVNVYVPNAGLGKNKGSNVGDGENSTGHGTSRIAYKLKFYKRLLEFCTKVVEEERREVVLVGDFNACFDARDVHSLIGVENAFLPCELDALRGFTACGFVDVYRQLHPDVSNVYTCFDQKTNARLYNRGVRIDFCLVSQGLAGKVKACEVVGGDVVPALWSDHCALYVEFDIDGQGDAGDAAGAGSLKEWVQLKRRLTNSSQKTLVDMFRRASKKAKTE